MDYESTAYIYNIAGLEIKYCSTVQKQLRNN